MKKTIGKKVLSMVITICMLVGLIPSHLLQFKVAATGDPTYKYDLYKLQYNGNRGYLIDQLVSFKPTTAGDPEEINPTVVSQPFKFEAQKVSDYFEFASSVYGFMLKGNPGDWVSLRIKVPEAGVYTPSVSCGIWANGPQMKFYLAPANAENARDAAYDIGTIDTYSSTSNWKTQKNLNKDVNLEVGEYVFSFEITGRNPANKAAFQFAIDAFGLTMKTPRELKLSADSAAYAIAIDSVYDYPITAKINGTVVDLAGATSVTAVSRDPSVATAAIDGNHVMVTGKKNGETLVDIAVTHSEKTAKITVPVRVASKAGYIYDYMKMRTSGSNGVSFASLTDYKYMTSGDPEEINKYNGVYSDSFMYPALGDTANISFADATYGCMFTATDVGQWASIQVHVAKGGSYTTVSRNGFWEGGSVVNLYLAPKSVGLSEYRNEKYLLGQIDSYKPKAQRDWVASVPLKDVNLEDNTDYILTYEYVKTNGGKSFPVGGFILKSDVVDYLSIGATDKIENKMGDTVTKRVYASLNGQKLDVSALDNLSVSVADAKIASARIENNGADKNLVVESIMDGSTTITLTGTYKGDTATCIIPISVTRPSYKYNYHKLRINSSSSVDIKTLTNFNMTRAYHPDEVTKSLAQAETDPYMFDSMSDTAKFGYASSAYGAMMDVNNAGDYTALKLEVLAEADYMPVSVNGVWPSGGIVDVFLAPESASNPRDAQYCIGTLDTYNVESKWAERTVLNKVSLKKGTYVLSYVMKGKGAGGAQRFAVGSFELALAPKDELLINLTSGTTAYKDADSVIPLKATLDGVPVALSAFQKFNVTPAASDIITFKGVSNDGLTVRGINTGKTTLAVNAEYNGIAITKDISVEVREPEFEYDYKKVAFQTYGKGIDIHTVTDFEMTTMGHPKEINLNAPYCDWTDPWVFVAEGGPSGKFNYTDTTYGCILDGEVGAWTSLKIKVPVSGVYTASTRQALWANSCIANIYLAPENAINPMDKKYLLKQVDSYKAAPYEWENVQPLRNVTLDAGDYVLSYEIAGRNPSGGLKYLVGAFLLTKAVESKLYLSHDNISRVMAGSNINTPIYADINGVPVDLLTATITAKSSNEEVATASIEKNADKASLVINGLKKGKTTITMTATLNDLTTSIDFLLDVADPMELDYIKVSADKSTYSSGETGKLSINAYRMNGDRFNESELTPYYMSSNPRVMLVDASGNLTAVERGSSEVSAFVEIDGVLRKDVTTVNVDTDSVIMDAKIDAPKFIEIGEKLSLKISGKLVGGLNYTSSTAAQFEVVSMDPIDCALLDGNTLSGKALGTVTIKAIVPKTETQAQIETTPVTIQVYETNIEVPSISYNFRDSQSIAILDATIAKNGWQINRTQTDSEIIGNAQKLTYQSSGITCMSSEYNSQLKSDITFDVNIPNNGVYSLSVDGGKDINGSTAAIYVDGKYVGAYNFYGSSALNVGPAVTMNTVELSKGTHTVTVRRTNERTSLYIGSLTFNKVDKMPTFTGFTLSAEQNKLTIGEICKFIAGPQMSDGSPCNFGNLFEGNAVDTDNIVSLENLNPDIVIIENGHIRGLKVGQATLKLTGKYNGQIDNKTLSITVEDDKLVSITPTLEKTSLIAGEQVKIKVAGKTASGRTINGDSLTITAVPEINGIVSYENGMLIATGNGTTNIQVSATLNGTTVTGSVQVTVTGYEDKLIITAANTNLRPDNTVGEQISLSAIDALGNNIDLLNAKITYESLDNNVITVSSTGLVMPVSVGKADVLVTVTLDSKVLTGKINFNITLGKTCSSYYTPERVEATRENIVKYDWARRGAEAITKQAEALLDKQDTLYNMITTQQLPRGITVGYRYDPNAFTCKYCGTDIRSEYGQYGWILNPFQDEFKIQCPKCRRKFPSNDFKSYYQTGIDENGNWSYEKAKADGQEFLKNTLYPEMDTKLGVSNWGVDDGYGYRTGKMIVGTDNKQQEETHTYIAYYNHWGVWLPGGIPNGGVIQRSIDVLSQAYLQTGDIRFGRVGATLLDRVADVYPDMYIAPFFPRYFNADSTTPKGKMVGCEWQHGLTRSFVLSYDALYSLYDDDQVLSYIKNKAAKYNMSDKKQDPTMVRQRIEDNLLRQSYKDLRNTNICGNFGMHQSLAAYVGVVLDTMPETKEIIDWIFKSCTDLHNVPDLRGGNVMATMINLIDRDGQGSEAPGYNQLWLNNVMSIADALEGYKTYPAADLYQNPKFKKMFKSMFPLTLCRRTTAQIGDSSATGNNQFAPVIGVLIKGFLNIGDPEIAQFIYMMNGNSVEGLHGHSSMKDPEAIQQKVLDVIEKYGEYNFDRSQQMAGYGFSILRDGSYYPNAIKEQIVDTQRDFWIYYGGANSHRHADVLNLGIEAYGFNMAPEFGYPETADGSERSDTRFKRSIVHNTVMVNGQSHNLLRIGTNGNPLHFDDSGRVKVMDIDAPKSTTNGTSADANGIFRRTMVMVRVNDEISYGVDFFRVKGGNDHLYSFHAMSDEIFETEGLNLVSQKMGSYAGPDVPYGAAGYSNGFSWFNNVRRSSYPGNEFAVDFKIKDFRQLLPKPMDLHLRMTMLNDFDLNEVTLASSCPPQKENNPKSLEFVLARRQGNNLDSLFTTVFEPYNGERYIKSMSQVSIHRNGGVQPGVKDTAKAIKVELTNGNVDYIVYATNNKVQYRVDDKFDFAGFIGVYTEKNGEVVYTYGNDATKIGNVKGNAAYTGKVVDFTRELVDKNTITVTFDQAINPEILKNKWINIANGGTQNAAYPILGVSTKDNKNYILDIGDLTFIKTPKDANDLDAGYNYNIGAGMSFTIPLPTISK